MKRASISFEATGVEPVEQNANGLSAVFDRHLLMIGLWVFTGYYLGCKIGFALTFQPHPVSVLWPPNSVLVAALLLTPPRSWWLVVLAALHKSPQGRHFLPLRSVYRPVFVLVFRCRLRGVESLGARRVLGVDPYTVICKCRLSVNHRAVGPNMGHEWSSAPENSIAFALPGGMRRLPRFIGSQLCCPL